MTKDETRRRANTRQALALAAEQCGTWAALADTLTKAKGRKRTLSRQAVHGWYTQGRMPADWVLPLLTLDCVSELFEASDLSDTFAVAA